MTIGKLLDRHPEILAEFIRRATPQASSSALAQWLRSLPEAAGVHVPNDMAPYRRRYNCKASQGGPRQQRGKQFYVVQRRRKPTVDRCGVPS